jgi:hypothetical protein
MSDSCDVRNINYGPEQAIKYIITDTSTYVGKAACLHLRAIKPRSSTPQRQQFTIQTHSIEPISYTAAQQFSAEAFVK